MGHSIYIYSINFIEIIFISKNFLYKVKEQQNIKKDKWHRSETYLIVLKGEEFI